jgi:hypothetical protein
MTTAQLLGRQFADTAENRSIINQLVTDIGNEFTAYLETCSTSHRIIPFPGKTLWPERLVEFRCFGNNADLRVRRDNGQLHVVLCAADRWPDFDAYTSLTQPKDERVVLVGEFDPRRGEFVEGRYPNPIPIELAQTPTIPVKPILQLRRWLGDGSGYLQFRGVTTVNVPVISAEAVQKQSEVLP